MDDIQISIIMPAFNASKYMRPAIESVLSQTYDNWQLIIVDDGSTDDTLRIAQEYAASDSKNRIVVVHQENSGTAAAARNTALEYVNGEYIQILDSDDYLSTNYLDCVNRCLGRTPCEERAQVVSGIAKSIRDDGEVVWSKPADYYVGTTISGNDAFVQSLDWTIHGWTCIDTVLMSNLRFDPKLINGDEFTTRKVFANANKVSFIEGIYYYRDNEGSTTKTSKNRARMFEALITDGNIYRYAISLHMPENCMRLCARKWCKSIIAHEAQYLRDEGCFLEKDKEYILDILRKNFEEIYDDGAVRLDYSIYGKALKACKRKFTRLVLFAHIYNIAWHIAKSERK